MIKRNGSRRTPLRTRIARGGPLYRAIAPWLVRWRPGNVAMFHIGRSGSTVLAEMLRQHMGVFWASELYARLLAQVDPSNQAITPAHPQSIDLLARLETSMRAAGHRYYGVEIKFYHLAAMAVSLQDHVVALEQRGFERFIILKRRNYLRKIVSSVSGRRNRQYHMKKSDGVATLNPVALNVSRIEIDRDAKPLLDYLEAYDRSFAELDRILEGKAVLRLIYEDHIQDDPMVAYRATCEFLGLPPRNVEVSLSRTNPFPLRDVIENFDEVRAYLADTPYAWMCEE